MNERELIDEYVRRFQMEAFLTAPLIDDLRLFTFPAFTNIYHEESVAHYLYFLVEGRLQCTHYHASGRPAVFALSAPFTAIGDLEILSETPVHSNVIATTHSTLLGIPRQTVERYGSDDPRFLRFLIDELRKKLCNNDTLLSGRILPAAARLAFYILSEVGDDGSAALADKETLAALIGTTLRHLNRIIRELVDHGAITVRYPTIHVRNRRLLEEIAER